MAMLLCAYHTSGFESLLASIPEIPVVDYFMNMSDVESGKYYTEAVRWALADKITDGTTATTFSPNDDCLRGQIVTFLYRDFAKLR